MAPRKRTKKKQIHHRDGGLDGIVADDGCYLSKEMKEWILKNEREDNKAHDGVPREEIMDAITQLPAIYVRIARQNAKGWWTTVTPRSLFDTPDLLVIEEALAQVCGGGSYVVRLYSDAKMSIDAPIPKFKLLIEGLPKTMPGDITITLGAIAHQIANPHAPPRAATHQNGTSLFADSQPISPETYATMASVSPELAAAMAPELELTHAGIAASVAAAIGAPPPMTQNMPQFTNPFANMNIPVQPQQQAQAPEYFNGNVEKPQVASEDYPPPWPPGVTHYSRFTNGAQWKIYNELQSRNQLPQPTQTSPQMNPYYPQQPGYAPQAIPQLPPQNHQVHPDALALHMARQEQQRNSELRVMGAKLEEKVEAVRAEARGKEAQLREELDRERTLRQEKEREFERERARQEREATEARHRSDMEALKMSMQNMLQQQQKPVEPSRNQALDMVQMMVPFIPLMQTMIAGNQNKDLEQNKLLLTTLTQKPVPQPNQLFDVAKVALPVLAPIILKWFEQRSPEAQSALMATQTESQMMILKMIADMVQAQQGEAPQWWVPMVENIMGAVQATMTARAGQQPMLPQQPRALPTQPQQQNHVQEPQMNTVSHATTTNTGMQVDWAKLAAADNQAANFTKMVWDSPQFPAGMRTPEWLTILFNMHTKLDTSELSIVIVNHLEHLRDFNMLPNEIKGVFNLHETRSFVEAIVMNMPVAKLDAAYGQGLVDMCVQELTEREEERIKAEQEDDGDYEPADISVDSNGNAVVTGQA